MADSQEPAVPRKARRRWLQVSLRTLLLLVTLVAIGLGWFVNRGERQRRAVAALEAMGGGIQYDSPGTPPADGAFDPGAWLPRDYSDDVYMVILAGRNVTDGGMVHLKVLTRLKWLGLEGTPVTDAGLALIQGLIDLEYLSLTGTRVTDVGLAHIQGLTRLEELDLTSTAVTDAGLAHLKGLTRLKSLELTNTQVTDAGLPQLEGLTGLSELDLTRTKVTAAGVAKLHRALPKCEILY